MTIKTTAIAFTLALGSFATAAAAECTAEEVQAKTTELSEGMQAIAATDPEKMQEIATKMQERMIAAQTAQDQEAVCAAFDELLAELNG